MAVLPTPLTSNAAENHSDLKMIVRIWTLVHKKSRILGAKDHSIGQLVCATVVEIGSQVSVGRCKLRRMWIGNAYLVKYVCAANLPPCRRDCSFTCRHLHGYNPA